MSALRRRLFIPILVCWGALAWIVRIGIEPPLDATLTVWAHRAGSFLFTMAAGLCLVWPASLVFSPRTRWTCFGEAVLLSLLGSALAGGLAVTTNHDISTAARISGWLACWAMAIGGLMAAARHRRWLVVVGCALLVAALPAGMLGDPASALLGGPIAGVWALAHEGSAALQGIDMGTAVAVLAGGLLWGLSCTAWSAEPEWRCDG